MHTRAIDLTNKLRELERSRYKSLVLCGLPLNGKTALALEVCEEYGARYIDVAAEALPHITFPTLGVYGANEFYQWIKKEANASQTPLCIDEIEPLLATFPPGHLESFFGMLSWLEVRHPVLIVTRLETFLRKSNFPLERIYYISA